MTPKTERFEMRMDEETLARVDQWRAEQSGIAPSRAEAVRRLLEHGLTSTEQPPTRFTAGEKVMLMMMRDLHKHLNIETSEVDPDFVAEIIFGGHYWALDWEYPGLFHGEEADPSRVRFVCDVLEMWDRIEFGAKRLSEEDRAKLAIDADPFGRDVRFRGFDGNNESELLSIAGFLIKKMKRFSCFGDRDLNSHCPTVDAYKRMLSVFNPMKETLHGKELSVKQITCILREIPHPI